MKQICHISPKRNIRANHGAVLRRKIKKNKKIKLREEVEEKSSQRSCLQIDYFSLPFFSIARSLPRTRGAFINL